MLHCAENGKLDVTLCYKAPGSLIYFQFFLPHRPTPNLSTFSNVFHTFPHIHCCKNETQIELFHF